MFLILDQILIVDCFAIFDPNFLRSYFAKLPFMRMILLRIALSKRIYHLLITKATMILLRIALGTCHQDIRILIITSNEGAKEQILNAR